MRRLWKPLDTWETIEMHLPDAVAAFLFHCRYERNLSPRTLKAYSIDLRQFARFLSDDLHIPTVSGVDKASLRTYIQQLFSHLKEKSVKRKIATLRSFFLYLEREDSVAASPFRKLHVKIKESRRLPRSLPLHDLRSLFKHLYRVKEAQDKPGSHAHRAMVRDIAVLELLFATGARVAEVCNLRDEDVELRRGRVRILGKGRRERVLQLYGGETLTSVRAYREMWATEVNRIGYFFCNRRGGRLSEQSVRMLLRRHAANAGLAAGKRVTPHMLRHSLATLLLEEGVDIRYIQQILGHASVLTTQIYVEVTMADQGRILLSRHPRRKIR